MLLRTDVLESSYKRIILDLRSMVRALTFVGVNAVSCGTLWLLNCLDSRCMQVHVYALVSLILRTAVGRLVLIVAVGQTRNGL